MKVSRALLPLTLGGAAATVGAAAWVIADRMLEAPADVLEREPPPDADVVTVVSSDAGSITLRGTGAARRGIWGLDWGDGYGRVHEVLEAGDEGCTRRFGSVVGPPPETGVSARLDADAYPDDPSVLSIDHEEITYRSPAGEMPAWVFPAPGSGRRWAIFVHGRAGRRGQALRMIPTVHALGMTCMSITYRNDPDAPSSDDRRCHLGESEWEDVEGAVVTALARGAEEIVLYGYSMGATAVLTFLRTSPHAARVRAAVLEAPVVRWSPVLRNSAVRRGAPPTLATVAVPLAALIARLRAGLDWNMVDHVAGASDLRIPMLLIHGEDDVHVPIETVEPLLRRRPDLFRALRVPGAGHLTAWNVARDEVEATVASFLGGRPRGVSREVGDRARQVVSRGLRRIRGDGED